MSDDAGKQRSVTYEEMRSWLAARHRAYQHGRLKAAIDVDEPRPRTNPYGRPELRAAFEAGYASRKGGRR